MNRLDDIWKDEPNRKPLSEEIIHAYLEGKLDPEQQHEVEQWLAEESMEADALEGLKQMPVSETKQTVQRLNHGLNKQLKGRQRRRKKYFSGNQWVWISIIVLLFLVVLGFAVIRLSMPD